MFVQQLLTIEDGRTKGIDARITYKDECALHKRLQTIFKLGEERVFETRQPVTTVHFILVPLLKIYELKVERVAHY